MREGYAEAEVLAGDGYGVGSREGHIPRSDNMKSLMWGVGSGFGMGSKWQLVS